MASVVIEDSSAPSSVDERVDELVATFDAAFGTGEDVLALQFAEIVRKHAHRQGFRCLVATDADELIGFVYAFTSFTGEPPSEWYRTVRDAAGGEWIEGQLEVPWFAVRPSHQRRGIGTRLLEEVVADRPEPRAWLITRADDREQRAFYARRGWAPLAEDRLQSEVLHVILGRELRGRVTPAGGPRSG